MARTRGGGVISGVSTRPRRNMGKTKANDATVTQGSFATPCSSGGPDVESMKQQPPGKTRCGRRTSERRGASPSPTPDSVGVEPGRGRKILRRAGQTFTATASVSEGARALRGQDREQQQDGSLQGLLDEVESGARAGEFGEVQVSAGLRMMSSPQGSLPPGDTRCQSQARPPDARSGPTPSKPEVWRMLYVDPDVADPKLVAGRLEVAASMVLRCGCVFDVATDIVQALADVRGDTMSLYRAVFVNETLQRHKKSVQSIEGKHLAQFFRQAGMSAARIVLLVGGDVQFDTVDAGAHGLSAVLRKPFTRDGFCDVLRGMYLSGEPEPEGDAEKPTSASEEPSKVEHQPTKSTNTSPCTTCGSTPSSCPPCNSVYPTLAALPMTSKMTVSLDRSTGSAAAAAMAAAAAARAATVQTGGGVLGPTPAGFPDCLGFTPFPPAMIEQLRRYPIVAGFPRPGPPVIMPRRKYTKIAPREEDESAVAAGTVAAATGSQNTPSESGSLETISEAPAGSGDQNLEGLSRDSEEPSEGSTRRCD